MAGGWVSPLSRSPQGGLEQIDCAVRVGNLREASLFALGANTKHGLRLSIADKRWGVMKLLRDDEWRQMSDGQIANHVGVSDRFVAKLRRELAVDTPNVRSTERKFIHPRTGVPTACTRARLVAKKLYQKGLRQRTPRSTGTNEPSWFLPPNTHLQGTRVCQTRRISMKAYLTR